MGGGKTVGMGGAQRLCPLGAPPLAKSCVDTHSPGLCPPKPPPSLKAHFPLLTTFQVTSPGTMTPTARQGRPTSPTSHWSDNLQPQNQGSEQHHPASTRALVIRHHIRSEWEVGVCWAHRQEDTRKSIHILTVKMGLVQG